MHRHHRSTLRITTVLACAALASVLVGLAAPGSAHAKRAATAAERTPILRASTLPRCIWPKAKTTVSTSDLRWAIVQTPSGGAANCPLGDGYVIVRRSAASNQNWRHAEEGSVSVCDGTRSHDLAMLDFFGSCIMITDYGTKLGTRFAAAAKPWLAQQPTITSVTSIDPTSALCSLGKRTGPARALCSVSGTAVYTPEGGTARNCNVSVSGYFANHASAAAPVLQSWACVEAAA